MLPLTRQLGTLGRAFGAASEEVVPFSPSDISGLLKWHKADALALSDGAPVTSWADSSGVGGAALPGVVVNAPTLRTNALNSLPVVRLEAALGQGLRATMAVGATYSLFMVGRMSGVSLNRLVGAVYPESGNWVIGWHSSGAGILFANGFVSTGSEGFSTEWRAFSCSGTGSISSFYKSGNLIASNSAGVTSPGNYLAIGGYALDGLTELPDGEVAEIIIYNSVLSDADRQKVEGYIAHKWAMTADLPADHPYKSVAP
jgi:hypothetical protein